MKAVFQKKARSSYSKSEMFNHLIEMSSELTWIRDLPGKEVVWFASAANQEKFGIPNQTVGQEFWYSRVHPNDKEFTSKTFEANLNDPNVRDYVRQYRFKGSSDKWRYIKDKVRFIRDRKGVARQAMGVWEDITDVVTEQRKIKRLLKTLESDKNRFKIISELSNAVMWEENIKTGQLFWTAGNKTLIDFGLTKKDFNVSDWGNHIHPDDYKRSADRFRAAQESEEGVYSDEYRVIKADGSVAYIVDRGIILKNKNNEPIQALGGWVDVTKERVQEQHVERALRHLESLNEKLAKREEELAASEEELRALNRELSNKNKILTAQNEVLIKLQHLAKIGNWEYDPNEAKFTASKELYGMHDISEDFDLSRIENAITLYDENSQKILMEYLTKAREGILDPFDITLRSITPLGYTKWLRICAWTVPGKKNLPIVIGLTYDITYFKEAEERLRSSEEKFSKAFHNNPDLMILMKKDWIIVDINQKVLPLLGYQREELLGRAATDFSFFAKPSDREDFFEKFDADQVVEMEAELLKKEGGSVYTLLAFRTLEIDRQPYILAVIKDITDRKTAIEKFKTVFFSNPDPMVIIRKSDLVLVDVNDRTITGYSRDEMLGSVATDLKLFVHQKEREVFWEAFYGNRRFEMEAEWRSKDGGNIHVLISLEHFALEGTEHAIIIIKDISDRKAAEEKFAKAFDLSPDLILILREDDLVLIDCNRHLETLSGYTREEVIGKPSSAFELWAIPEDRDRHLSTYMSGDGSVFMESIFLRKDKSRFYGNISSRRIVLQGIKHMLVVVRDITERKLVQQRVVESEANLYAVLNNASLLVWSVDLEYKLITGNKPFEDYVRTRYKAKAIVGEKITPEDPALDDRLRKTWLPRYERVLKGEKYKITERYDERFVEFSLGPIIDNDQIIGIVIFADDITERVKQEQDLKNALNKVAEFKLMALRSVMNPHFFFNALSSIQFFIAQNDRKNAITYLSTFSKLVRGILEHSVNNTISLMDEIEQLKNYVVLEQLRFEDKFEYQIDIDHRLDLEGTEIPSLLIQPYVENAIIHGLYNKQGNGFLKISIVQQDNAILFEVKDNGIGRKAARELREKNMPGHKSMGTAITEERLSLINNQYQVSFEVLDLVDENGHPEGTSVKIWLKN